MRMNFDFLRYGSMGALTLTLAGCYVATPYGYRPYGYPVYAAYPVARYPAYPAQYQPAPAAPVAQPVQAVPAVSSVYFDFDSAAIKPEYQSVVQAQASYLLAHPEARVTLQGNADERGAGSYNQSLGSRRADAVRLALQGYGVPASQISTVSLGDASPAHPGKNEAAYAQNRRVDFHYP